ncbi:FimV family protein [Marichromatium bheemlicum]|uniref:FimV family protein n=1 Tax=Marichromatium bheemlicum TaxID=365339 RepID=A0ABX1I7Q1_9GAMM|nr:FimV family protein [Marichromatium bheemlicum]NKN33248.1 FimV family protein [Marichromatium bheemlicum]
MFRNFVLASAVVLTLVVADASALGLGSLQTYSALNQPFRGEIALIDVNPDTLDTVRVELAPSAVFDRAGLERYHYLTELEFTPGLSARGEPVVQITSQDPVREPYLDFLIQATWPDGQLVRGYTVLLDPPVSTQGRAPAVATPRVSAPAAEVRAEPQRASVPPAAADRAEQSAIDLPEGVDPSVFPVKVGPVPEGVGLWQFALDSRTQGASLAQTAMALYRANQDAFIQGDINRLIAGETLTIPSAEELFALEPSAAQSEFQAAMQGQAVNRAPLAPPPPEPARLKIAGEVGEVGQETPARSAEVVALEQELLTVMQAHESTRQETLELRAHIRELESRLSEIQELLQARNAEVARLQAVAAAAREPVPAAPAESEPPLAGVAPQVAPESAQPRPEPAAPESPDSDASTETETMAAVDAEPTTTEAAAADSIVEPEPVVAQDDAADSLWHALLLPLAGFAAVAALGLIGFSWWSSRRRQREDTELVSTLEIESELAPLDVPARGASAASRSVEEESTFSELVDEPSASPFSALTQLDSTLNEADPIAEADIYIAYGRYDEAVRLLDGELENTPERMDLRLKLAEAYAAMRDAAALDALVEATRTAGGERNDPEGWQRLLAMQARLTQGGAGSSAPREYAGLDADSTAADESISLRLEDVADPAAPRPPEAAARHDEFDLPLLFDDTDLEEPPAEEVDKATEPAPASASTPSHPAPSRSAPAQATPARAQPPARPEAEVEDSALPDEAGDSELMLTLEDIDGFSDSDLAPPSKPQSLAPESTARPSGGGEVRPIADAAPSEFLLSQWEMDSGLWDENATKLDLARAYLDMDDKEAARGILDEVIADGRDDQRQEARQLLERLG